MTAEPRETQDSGVAIQEVIYAALDLVRAVVPLDLCAYLHASSDMGPQLFLRAPDLSTMDPTDAFTLFASFRDALEAGGADEDEVAVGRYSALMVRSRGERSRGLHVLGRLDAAPAGEERRTAVQACRAGARVAHLMEALSLGEVQRPTPARVGVEIVEGGAHARVTVLLPDGPREGVGDAADPARAVALAVVGALDAEAKVVEALDDEIAGERVTVVLLTGADDERVVGAALSDRDPLHAAAVAALEATMRLSPNGVRQP